MKYYYKVVSAIDMSLYSAIGNPGTEDPLCVAYKKGSWVSAPRQMAEMGYHLLVFEGLYDASRFMYTQSRTLLYGGVWACTVDGIVTPIPPMLNRNLIQGKGVYIRTGEEWPRGTVMVRRVMLLRKTKTAELWKGVRDGR